jgi:hypothetical protein
VEKPLALICSAVMTVTGVTVSTWACGISEPVTVTRSSVLASVCLSAVDGVVSCAKAAPAGSNITEIRAALRRWRLGEKELLFDMSLLSKNASCECVSSWPNAIFLNGHQLHQFLLMPRT